MKEGDELLQRCYLARTDWVEDSGGSHSQSWARAKSVVGGLIILLTHTNPLAFFTHLDLCIRPGGFKVTLCLLH